MCLVSTRYLLCSLHFSNNGLRDLRISASKDVSYHFWLSYLSFVFSCDEVLVALYLVCCLCFPRLGSSSVGPMRYVLHRLGTLHHI